MTTDCASSPCVRALKRDAALPASVRGPVDLSTLARLALICAGSCHDSSFLTLARGGLWGDGLQVIEAIEKINKMSLSVTPGASLGGHAKDIGTCKFRLVGEICGSPIRSNGRRKLGSRSPRTRCGIARLQLFLFVASFLSNYK